MKPLAIKLLAGSGTVVGVGGISYLTVLLTDTTDTIENYLKESALELVSAEITSIAEWNKAFDTYQIEKEEADLKIIDKEITKGKDIQEWCKDAKGKSVKSALDPLYKKFSYWCTKYKTIEEQLGVQNPFEEKPEALEKKHNHLPEPFKSEIEKLNLKLERTVNQNGEKIKQWCKDNKKRKFDKRNKAFVEKISKHCLVSPTTIEI